MTVVLTVTYAVVAYRVLKRQELSDMLVSPSTSYTPLSPALYVWFSSIDYCRLVAVRL